MPPFGELPLDGVVATFRSALDQAMGLEPSARPRAGTTVTSSALLEGTGRAVVARAERHRVVWCDPSVVDEVADLAGPTSPEPEELVSVIRARGADAVGTSVLHVVHRRGLLDVEAPDGASFAHPPVTASTEVVAGLVTDCPAAEVAEAGLDDVGDDARLTIGRDRRGVAMAVVVRRSTAMSSTFEDLGVLVRPSARGRGWGAGAVGAAARRSFATGRLPLYRSEVGHETALRLAARLGFRRVGELWVSRFCAECDDH